MPHCAVPVKSIEEYYTYSQTRNIYMYVQESFVIYPFSIRNQMSTQICHCIILSNFSDVVNNLHNNEENIHHNTPYVY